MKKMVHCELADNFQVLKSLGTAFELDVEGVGCCCHFVLELLLYKVKALLPFKVGYNRFSSLKIISLLTQILLVLRFGKLAVSPESICNKTLTF